jgi:subtilisin-like proprotein convertase family protein
VRRLVVLPFLLALIALPGAASGGPVRTLKGEVFSSGNISAAIPDGATLEHTITVAANGEVARVAAVWIRLDHARDSDLSLRLVAPNGKSVLLSAWNGGTGTNYGSGSRDCAGTAATFGDGGSASISSGTAPFVGDLFKPQQALAKLNGSRTDGVWKLRVTDRAPGATGTLFCWRLILDRLPAKVEKAHARTTSAELSYVVRSVWAFANARLKIVRGGVVVYDKAITKACRYCEAFPSGYWSGASSLAVRDLDADGEPEVLTEFYTGGAHCCSYTTIHRYVGAQYRPIFHWWGDLGYRFADLDHNRILEFMSYDDRFAYAFSCFACSFFPIQIWDFRGGKMVDVTRRFPPQIRADARSLWRSYVGIRRAHADFTGVLPAWLADEYLLGRGAAGWKQVRAAATGFNPSQMSGWTRVRYLRAVKRFLRQTGYSH